MPASAADRSSTLHVPGQPDQQLQAPLLNITVNNLAGNIYYQGRTFNVSQIQDMGTCTPQQRYRWGFSSILLFMWLSVTWLLSIFMYLVWAIHYWQSHRLPEEAGKVLGSLRTAMALTESIRQEFGEEVASRLSDDALRKALRERGAGVSLQRLSQANSFYGLQDMRSKATTMYRVPSPHKGRASTLSADSALRYGRSQSSNSLL